MRFKSDEVEDKCETYLGQGTVVVIFVVVTTGEPEVVQVNVGVTLVHSVS